MRNPRSTPNSYQATDRHRRSTSNPTTQGTLLFWNLECLPMAIMSPGITWQVWLVVGVLAGAFATSKLAGEVRARWLPDTRG